MVNSALTQYVRTLRKQGYDAPTIRRTLRDAGYSPYEIKEAFADAEKPTALPTKTIIIAFIAVLVIALGTILVLKLLQPEPVTMTLSLRPYKMQVSPGEPFVMTAQIDNPSGRKTNVMLDVQVTGPTPLSVASQTANVVETAGIPVTVQVPETANIGSYTVKAQLAYKEKTAQATLNFQVVQKAQEEKPSAVLKPIEEETREEIKECPGGCDDLDPCTEDECVEGVCVHTPIIPCCGNRICEAGEQQTCKRDCPDTKDALGEAKQAAANNPTRAARLCSEAGIQADTCYKEIADISNDKQYCDYVQESIQKDGCLMNFAYKGDFTVCEMIKNKFMRNSCNTLKRMKQN